MNDNHFSNTSINCSVLDASRSRETAWVVVESCIFLFLEFSALVGNLLVCLAFCRNPSLRRSATNYFVLSLALADLFMAVLVMPLSVSASLANKWLTGDFGCQLVYVCGNSLTGTSLLTVMLIAVNRFLHITRPALFHKVYSKKYTVLMAISAWILPIVLMTGRSLASTRRFQTFAVQPTQCFQVFPDTSQLINLTVIQNALIAIPSLVIVICYVKIYQAIRHHNTAIDKSSQEGHSAYGVEEARITRIMALVVVGFYLCWLPVFISNILRVSNTLSDFFIKFSTFCFLFPVFTGSVINPVIYATMSQPFRKEFLKILRPKHY